MHHLRDSLRILRTSPGFSIVAIAVLALGTGSNLAVFSLIDSLFLKPLPVDKPAGLVRISSIDRQGRAGTLNSKVLDGLRREAVLEGLCAFTNPTVATKIDGTLGNTQALTMSGDCFTTLGLRTQIGRPFTAGEDRRGAEKIALLTDSLWRSAFASSPAVLDRTLEVEGEPVRIIGVTAPQFTGLYPGSRPGLILPLEQTSLDFVPNPNRPVYYWVDILARRAPAVSLRSVQARLGVIQSQLLEQSVPLRYNEAQRRDYFAHKIVALSAGPGANTHLKERFGDPLWAILGICGAVLLIACVNLTTLLLARGLRRRKEIAVRLALGAGRASVARLVALESGWLVLMGTLAGVLLSRGIIRLLIVQAGEMFAIDANPQPDVRTVCFVAGMVLLTLAILAAAPAWQTGRVAMLGSRGVVGTGARSQKILLGAQVALTLALVSTGSLFTSSMRQLDELNLGVKTADVAEAILAPVPGVGRNDSRTPYFRDLLRRVEELPGVTSAALSDFAPFWTGHTSDPVALLDNGPAPGDVRAQTISVTDGLFATLGIPLLAGETFAAPGQEPAEPVAMVSQSLANLLGGAQVIGKHIRVGDSGPYQRLKVIGISGDAQLSLENPEDTRPLSVYVNLWQFADRRRSPALLVKAGAGALPSAAEIRRVVQAVGRDYIQHIVTLEAQRSQALIENQWLAWLSAAFGVLALGLAATGLFGLLSYHVASRTAEIGLRMALGAERPTIHRLVLQQLLPVMATGIAAGLALALALARLLSSLIFGVSVYDPRLLAASVMVLALTALGAAWLPARKAASIDPLAALRHD